MGGTPSQGGTFPKKICCDRTKRKSTTPGSPKTPFQREEKQNKGTWGSPRLGKGVKFGYKGERRRKKGGGGVTVWKGVGKGYS